MSIKTLSAAKRGMAREFALQVRDELTAIGTTNFECDRQASEDQADYAFKRLAETLGYRVEKIEPEASSVVNFRGEVPALRSAIRPGFNAAEGVPA